MHVLNQPDPILLSYTHSVDMNIELYSIRGFTGSALKEKLEQALASHHMPYTITEIFHVDQFIKAGLASVPAFKIGDKIIQHPHDGDVNETVSMVINYILSENVNSILVAVDFSEESNHAIAYARMMAQQLGYGLTLAHVHQTLYDPISAGALDVQILQDANKRLEDMVETLNLEHAAKGINVHVNASLEVGEAASSLVGLLDHGKFELMIMATKATDNAMRRFFGTVSSEVSRQSHKPVVVVPPKAEVKFPGKMIVGFTEELILNGALEYILNFGAKHNVFFDFVHVTDDRKHFEILKGKLYEKLVLNRNLLCGFNIRALEDDEKKIHEVLFKYAADVRAGMVILVSHHRGFIDNLRHSSVTRKALHHPDIPLMIIHQQA
jgi:nucleotide-binding universal stress UspA family protein